MRLINIKQFSNKYLKKEFRTDNWGTAVEVYRDYKRKIIKVNILSTRKSFEKIWKPAPKQKKLKPDLIRDITNETIAAFVHLHLLEEREDNKEWHEAYARANLGTAICLWDKKYGGLWNYAIDDYLNNIFQRLGNKAKQKEYWQDIIDLQCDKNKKPKKSMTKIRKDIKAWEKKQWKEIITVDKKKYISKIERQMKKENGLKK